MLCALILLATVGAPANDSLAANFAHPPLSARPHTWWHWLNGNVTKEGITADLEAMKQVGIGGAQMFTVDQGVPAGPAKYAGTKWRQMTQFAVKEAARLGIELCIHNGAGWSSSGGPWITPQDAMQVIAWSEKNVHGPRNFADVLPQPKAPQVESEVPYYRDIAVFAYRTPSEGDTPSQRPPQFLEKTGVVRGGGLQVDTSPSPAGLAIPANEIVPLSDKLDGQGKLTWDVPDGDWTILRIGHVPTGVHNHPAPPEGDGLEVDKLSKEALDHHWAGLMAKVVSDAGRLAGKSLNNVLIDSYEVGTQNWSPSFRVEFMRRRGYDPLPWLPVVTGMTIDSHERSERFLWDLRRTIADLYADNYYGHMADLAHQNGLMFSAEPYGNGGFDTIESGGKEDIPMAEFWLGGSAMETTKLASSVGHIYGRPIIGAESFTSDVPPGRWLEQPYDMKALGDLAFCNGINRYIFHRYAMQPWLNLKPGMTMGPWGTHIERTQTWWGEAATYMQYVARCQYLLQSGLFVADACYYYGEDSPNDLLSRSALKPELPIGYDYDGCDSISLKKMTVKNGRVVLPSGMSYAVLVLPNSKFMTPSVARKVEELVSAGATVYGPRPVQSPSLQGYPACDDQVRVIGERVWGAGAADKPISRAVGKGHIYSGQPLVNVLAAVNVRPDFEYQPMNFATKLVDIHRHIQGADVYFVSNQNQRNTSATCSFRVSGRIPELWHPETGVVEDAPAYSEKNGRTSIHFEFGPSESVFVVFRKSSHETHLKGFSAIRGGASGLHVPKIEIEKARYESVDGRGADVTEVVRSLAQGGQLEIPASNSVFGDPVVNVVKHLVVEYRLDGKFVKRSAGENETLNLTEIHNPAPDAPAYEVVRAGTRKIQLTAWKPASFVTEDTRGTMHAVTVSDPPLKLDLGSNWRLTFPPHLGAPTSAFFGKLISWPTASDPGIKYFSGTATYSKAITVPANFIASSRAIRLNLGHVMNFATVILNGQTIATLWKPPFALDVTKYVRPGANRLEVKVTNLWPNRLIGDEQLPADVEWTSDGHLAKWPDWLLNGKPRPKTGRIAFATWHFWSKDSPLLESGLIGPVSLQSAKKVTIRY
ncbi:MAG: glycosyl hydrolase [Fimbriimonas sp.]|nr:glycosyl hydrolase [Fimbriimonas sp.]